MSRSSPAFYPIAKRIFDVTFAAAAIVALFPIFVVVAIALMLTGDGSVFFRQPRVGKGGRMFRVWKFVTMVPGSELQGSITVKNDRRVTPIGRFLRKTKINELPQLLNVLAGDMSIVGPRPLAEEGFAMYSESMKELVCRNLPGLTGIGSIVFRDEEDIIARSTKPPRECYRDEVLPIKGELEQWYDQHKSLSTDMAIIALTVVAIVRPKSTLYRRWLPNFTIVLPARVASPATRVRA